MSFEDIHPTDAKARIEGDPEVVVVDVRTVGEFDEGHVPGAYNVPFAFKGPLGMQPNPDFAAAMQRIFASDAKLVLV